MWVPSSARMFIEHASWIGTWFSQRLTSLFFVCARFAAAVRWAFQISQVFEFSTLGPLRLHTSTVTKKDRNQKWVVWTLESGVMTPQSPHSLIGLHRSTDSTLPLYWKMWDSDSAVELKKWGVTQVPWRPSASTSRHQHQDRSGDAIYTTLRKSGNQYTPIPQSFLSTQLDTTNHVWTDIDR